MVTTRTLLDMRHRWGEVQQTGCTFSRTCLVCGRVATWETLIPNAVVDALFAGITIPARNPYRELVR